MSVESPSRQLSRLAGRPARQQGTHSCDGQVRQPHSGRPVGAQHVVQQAVMIAWCGSSAATQGNAQEVCSNPTARAPDAPAAAAPPTARPSCTAGCCCAPCAARPTADTMGCRCCRCCCTRCLPLRRHRRASLPPSPPSPPPPPGWPPGPPRRLSGAGRLECAAWRARAAAVGAGRLRASVVGSVRVGLLSRVGCRPPSGLPPVAHQCNVRLAGVQAPGFGLLRMGAPSCHITRCKPR